MPELFQRAEPSVRTFLDRHEQRRRGGVPALTVLAGPVGLGVQAWRRWCTDLGRPVAAPTTVDPACAVAAWIAAAVDQSDPTREAVVHLARCLGRSAEALRAELATKSLHDLEQLLAPLALEDDRDGAGRVCLRLVRRLVAGTPSAPGKLAADLAADGVGPDRPWLRVAAGLHALLRDRPPPTLLLACPEPPPDSWLDAAGSLLAALVATVPCLTAAVAVPGHLLRHHLRTARESHALALLREGLVEVPAATVEVARDHLQACGAPWSTVEASVRRLVEEGASDDLLRTFAAAARDVARGAADHDNELARSAAERILYERLESLATTAGLFALNRPLEFPFGPRAAEVDLLARDLRLVVEVDGFFHFCDNQGYRRDRRKDFELQRHGYLVVRCLAEDVHARLGEVLDIILAAVAHRRSTVATVEVQR